MDLQSILGYASGSPYATAPYLDIQSPEGAITMENTPIDLLGIDNLGNVQYMKAGRKKDYKFPGTKVREVPVRGNPYQSGGMTGKKMFDFLFDGEDDDDNTPPQQMIATAPSVDEVDMQSQMDELDFRKRMLDDQESYMMAMGIANQPEVGNPYRNRPGRQNLGDENIFSSGQFGNQNVGQYGRRIYSQLSQDLGYNPVANSIYRSEALNNSLPGAVKNSFHLTGDAVDLKPQDWHKLSEEQQLFYRQNYDVVYHNNHYHIEPK